ARPSGCCPVPVRYLPLPIRLGAAALGPDASPARLSLRDHGPGARRLTRAIARLRRAAADAALPDQSAFSIQHVERDLDARAGKAQRAGGEHAAAARWLSALLARPPTHGTCGVVR